MASRFAVLLFLVAGSSVGGCSVGGGEGSTSCAFVADYGGQRYSDAYEAEFMLGETVGTAVLPACDTGGDGDPGVGEREVGAYAVVGVDPKVAIAVDGATDILLVAQSVRDQPPDEVRQLLIKR